ncbi:purine-binding chemotaxis protein CheW [Catenuloplanes nepalensis]|uniref:Purine-binding chemotaxis protein CheW n=1 Tax=Catenuloplanes nepalensis TaxID=587533 RepID=A0ABT9N7I5_9ACTN|nr:chemotaxis protein CheW [Catenuloplanes nepalensis]MDP9799654.1 purine-binding chemotaxis protein CheW [Catenuloplanes nepalensis]
MTTAMFDAQSDFVGLHASADTLFGVFRIDRIRVALPLTELREVIPCPPTFSPLPARAPGLVGAVNLRHLVIPVLDLRKLQGIEETADDQVIVIVAQDGRVFGLIADEIEGVSRVAGDALMRMTVGGDLPSLFSHSFERPDDDAVVSLLDAEAIAALPGMPVVRDTGPRGVPVEAEGVVADASRRTVMLITCGEIGLAMEVNDVHSVIPTLTVRMSPLDGPACRGVVHLHGHAVPAVDPLGLLGLGAMAEGGPLRGVVLALPRGLIVLTVNDVAHIASVPNSDVLPLPPLGMPKSEFLAGVLQYESGRQYVMVDGAAMRRDAELDALAALGLPLDPRKAAAATGRAPGEVPSEPPRVGAQRTREGRRVVQSVRKFLTYSVGVEAATLLSQIGEILPYPEEIIPLDAGGAIRGVFTHRRTSVPLLCLPTLLGRWQEIDPVTSRVLLVGVERDGGGTSAVGFVVPSLHAIEDSVWEESGGENEYSGRSLSNSPLVKIGTEEQGRMMPHIDLHRIAAAELAF